MKKTTFYLILALLSATACSAPKQIPGTPPDTFQWHSIFNGSDLEGWEKMGNFGVEVINDVIVLTATQRYNNAWLLTDRNYDNFELELDFLVDGQTNSGVLFRFNPGLAGLPNSLAYEANIDWRSDRQEPMGTIEHAARAKLLKEPRPGQWVRMKIHASGDHLQVYLDEELLTETHHRRSLKGRIGLQVPPGQGGKIRFRNIRIRELPAPEFLEVPFEDYYRGTFERPLVPLLSGENITGWQVLGGGQWSIDPDGVLYGYSEGGNSIFTTTGSYRNFYLKCKFKIAKEDNSGIFIRKHPDSTNVSLDDAIECNIYDHNGYTHAYSTGSIVGHARAWSHLIDYDDWNSMEIFARENRIILYVNGLKSAEASVPDSFNKAGNISLQAGPRFFSDQGPSQIWFKDLYLRNMDGL